MASGHVNRTQRPHTWLLRPDCDVQKSPCQRGAVHTWHHADDHRWSVNMVGFLMDSRSAGQ